MASTAQIELLPAAEVAQRTPVQQALNGINYATYADIQIESSELEQVINAIPTTIAGALKHRSYYFVPLTIHEGPLSGLNDDGPEADLANAGETLIAAGYSTELSDRAICHRNVKWSNNGISAEGTFISTRLMHEKFALAFELFINVGHQLVDTIGVPGDFMDLVWSQAEANVRGETSQDAWENRRRVLDPNNESSLQESAPARRGKDSASDKGWPSQNAPRTLQNGTSQNSTSQSGTSQNGGPRNPSPHNPSPIDEQAKLAFLEAAFSDALAIYMLSLALDFDYADLREREYPLLAAPALAERLRHVARLFPPNPGYEFQVLYRRR